MHIGNTDENTEGCLLLNDGLDDNSFVDGEGDTWFKADEYGDRSFMWEYR